MHKTNKTYEEYLQETFGYSSFRLHQKEIIDIIVKKTNDVLGVFFTSYGKSILYQLPPIITNKPAIVISPLISLMEDQKNQLEKVGVSVCCYDSKLYNRDMEKTNIINGKYKIIYFTPEMIMKCENLLKSLQEKQGISVVAVDESHCISIWGHTFRDSYRQLSVLKSWLPTTPLLALTATATQKVQYDIINSLGFKNPMIFMSGSNRPNLSYSVFTKTNPIDDLVPLLGKDSAIVYVQKKDTAESLSALLRNNGITSEPYHAEINIDTKKNTHNKFVSDEISTIVATIAYGMGINKSNIRKVIHYGCPKDIESYVQETGRCGRNNSASECIIFFSPSDFNTNRFFIQDLQNDSLRHYRENMLNDMIKYLYITDCRREYLLNYFGEKNGTYISICCDNCSGKNMNSVDIGPQAKNILKLIQYSYNRNYGKNMYIDVLRGSASKKINYYFTQCQWYGIYKDKSREWLDCCIRYIINCGLISEKVIAGCYGTIITLEQKGIDWLMSNDNPGLIIKVASHDSILLEAPKKQEPANKTPHAKKDSTKNEPSPTVMETYKMFYEQNKSFDEISTERNLKKQTIESHIVDCVEYGLSLDICNFISLNEHNTIIKVIDEQLQGDISKLSPIKQLCPNYISYFQIKLSIIIKNNHIEHLLK